MTEPLSALLIHLSMYAALKLRKNMHLAHWAALLSLSGFLLLNLRLNTIFAFPIILIYLWLKGYKKTALYFLFTAILWKVFYETMLIPSDSFGYWENDIVGRSITEQSFLNNLLGFASHYIINIKELFGAGMGKAFFPFFTNYTLWIYGSDSSFSLFQ